MKGKSVLASCLLLSLTCLSCAMLNHVKAKASSLSVHNLNTGMDYATIQDAIDANETVDGNTIKADAGTYYEHVIVNKSITLVGDGSNATIIDGNGTGVLTGFRLVRAIIVLKADIVHITNLTVRNAGLRNGLGQYDACIDCLRSQRDINVENNVLQGAGRGVVVGNGVSSTIINSNIISDIIGYAIDIGGWTSPTATNVTVSNNVIHRAGGSGINLDGETSNCTILNNTVADSFRGIDLGPNVNTGLVPEGNLIDGNILVNSSAVNIMVMASPNPSQASYTNTFCRNNLTNSQHCNLLVWGYNSAAFVQDIDDSNIANNKRIYYLKNVSQAEIDPTNCPDAGYLALVNCTNVVVKNFNFASNNDGFLMAYSVNCTITNMTLGEDHVSVASALRNESYLLNWGGLTLYDSTGNTIADSTIYNNTCGVCLCHSNGNTFYDNIFTNNDRPVVSDSDTPFENMSTGYFSANFWDNGVEGNYWSDYNSTDSDQDGISDTPYVIDSNNTDNYPLMGMFHGFDIVWQEKTYAVNIISNSTISDQIGHTILTISQWLNHTIIEESFGSIYFYVSGEDGTYGFCRVHIPVALLNSTYRVTINTTEVPCALLPCSNITNSYLYFTYAHSTERVEITPEFPPLLILPLFMIATLVAVIVHKRRYSY